MKFSELLGKKVGVLGLGITGKSFINIIKNLNIDYRVWDDKPDVRGQLDEELKSHVVTPIAGSWDDIEFLFVSPGISLDYPKMHPIVEMAKRKNIPFYSDIDLFFANSRGGIYIGVTGTNGKSTTVSLLAHIIKKFKKNTFECGNIGVPVLSLLSESDGDSHYVIELSSFQLDLLKKNILNVSVLLNISNDHLDRYAHFGAYVSSKKSIFNSMKSTNQSIINVDDENCRLIYDELKADQTKNLIPISTKEILPNGFSYVDGRIYNKSKFASPEESYEVPEIDSLKGVHNQINLLAAIACAKLEGVEIDLAIEAAQSFVALRHRLEKVAEIDDICFINDSKATNAHAAKFALESFKNIYWLAGGRSKQDDFSELDIGMLNVKKAYLYGEAREKLAEYVKSHNRQFAMFENIDMAFEAAFNDAMADKELEIKNILLAPACASLDQFENYMKRGDRFVGLVKNIKAA